MKLVVLIRLMSLKLLFKEVEILKDKKFLISLISQKLKKKIQISF